MGQYLPQGNRSMFVEHAYPMSFGKWIMEDGMVNQTRQGKLGFASEGDCEESIWKMSCQRQDFAAVESDPQRQCRRTVAYVNWYWLEVWGQEESCIVEEGRVSVSSRGCHPQSCQDRGLGRVR